MSSLKNTPGDADVVIDAYCHVGLPLENLTPHHRASVMYHNAQRLIFDQPAPARESVKILPWIDRQFNRDRVVPLFPDGLHIPMHVYQDLHHRYIQSLTQDPNLRLSAFLIQLLEGG